MATRIRLARGGKKKAPFYRIVVADGRAPRDGKFIERIGSYDPLLSENKVILDLDRARHWLDVGAQPSERVAKLFSLQGIEHKLVVIKKYPEAKKAPAKATENKPESKPETKAEDKPAEAKATEGKAEEKPESKAEDKPAEKAEAAKPEAKPPEPKATEDKAEEKPEVKAEEKAEESKAEAAKTEAAKAEDKPAESEAGKKEGE